MKRKAFLKKGLLGVGTVVVGLPTVMASCSNSDDDIETDNTFTTSGDGSCTVSPQETAGPFPIITPASLVKANIISDRNGVALLINLTVNKRESSDVCNPLAGVYVDLWHCDSEGNYSQYGGTNMQSTNYSDKNFLRGRQLTDSNGQVSFISIFPGWYRGRAPHIHIEILDTDEKSLGVTQIAFPKEVCNTVYSTTYYNGEADTSNESDNVFSDSLDGNMADSVSGNTEDGYTLEKVITV
ncbi:intradiol ring-cleavage dioxygenase [Formosa sp. S-31]|uniref:dioxygenase family protein n=1 Tax=Formosa sp. S-31 TaxID=2790949 RepID=UPI003EB90E22